MFREPRGVSFVFGYFWISNSRKTASKIVWCCQESSAAWVLREALFALFLLSYPPYCSPDALTDNFRLEDKIQHSIYFFSRIRI